MSEKKYHLDTIAVHQNFRGDDKNSVARGIYPSTAFIFDDADHGADLFDLKVAGNIYSRLTNPTNDDLGNVVSDLEGGVGGLAVSSGASAVTATVLAICNAGDHILATKELYGGTLALFANTLNRLGIETTFVDQDTSKEELKSLIQPNTKLIFAEVLGNPNINVLDCEKFSQLAKEAHIPFVVDNTFSPPGIFNAKEHGADIIVHSATKYLGGHGNALAGVIVDCGTFDWTSGKFPAFTTPDPAYHGLVYSEAFGNAAFIYKVRTQVLRDTGLTASPFNSYLILNGLQTLNLRLKHVSENALKLAKWLEAHEGVASVSYPLLESHKDYARAVEYFENGAGGILSFQLKGDLQKCKNFINHLELCINAVNVGDVRTIVSHPASTTHRQSSAEELAAAGITDNFIRISVGLENIEDVIQDLDQAIRR